MNSQVKVLMLAYYYPPIKSMGVMRAYHLSHEWLVQFEKVSVITTTNNQRLQRDVLPIDERIEVAETKTFDYRTITSYFSNKSHYSEKSKESWLAQLVVKFLNSFPFSNWIGEGGFIYRRAAFKKACLKIENEKYTHIFSSFRPYTDHVIARKIKKRYPHIKWIADFRDIHIDVLKKNVLFESYQHQINRRLLSSADTVTTVSEGCAEHIRKYYPEVHVIHNGIDPKAALNNAPLPTRFTLAYTGSLYGDMRNPSVLFEALLQLKREGHLEKSFRIVYAGKDSVAWNEFISEYNLGDHSDDRSLVDLQESKLIQRQSHINIQLTFAHPEVTGAITGKVMEYVASKRPILCIINGSEDKEIETFFDRVNGSKVVYNREQDVEVVKNYVLTYYNEFLKNQLEVFELDQPLIEQMSWSNISKRFLDHL